MDTTFSTKPPILRPALVTLAVLLLNAVLVWLVFDLSSPDRAIPTAVTSEEVGPDPVAPPSPDPALPSPVARSAGLEVSIRPLATGRVEVVERVTPPGPRSTLDLTLPRSSFDAASRSRVVDLVIEADGTPVAYTPPSTFTTGWSVRLPARTEQVVLRYTLVAATELTRPGRDLRASLTHRPLAARSVGAASAVVEVVGVTVHNLVCPDRPLADQLCGRVEDDRWLTATMPATRSRIVAQVDLPESSPDAA